MAYLYEDEDNAPMNEDAWQAAIHMTIDGQPQTVNREEPLPFTDPPEHPDGCWNCFQYDGDRCMKNWNNADPDYYNPDTDDKEPTDWCDYHDRDPSAEWSEFFDDDT